MDRDRRRFLYALVVGVLLIASGVLPQPVFASPYQTSEPAPYLHQAVPEDSSTYERLVDLYGFDPAAATAIEELSPVGQRAVDRTITSQPDDDGWLRYELPVCRERLLVCDTVREPPSEFHYGEGTPQQVFRIIEADGQRYLLQTGVQTDTGLTDGLATQPDSTYLWIFGLLPFGTILIVSQVIGAKTGRRRLPLLLTAVGAGLLVVGIAVPYLSVAGVISYAEVSRSLLVGVIGLTLVAAGGLVWQTVQYTASNSS